MKTFKELIKKLSIFNLIKSIFIKLRKNNNTFIYKGIGENYNLFSSKKWGYIYENPKTGKIKVSNKKIDKYHT